MTSIQWLKKELQKGWTDEEIDYIFMLFKQAEEMHKKEIIDAIEEDVFHSSDKTAEQYYNETFNK
jgi:hypothetical protein